MIEESILQKIKEIMKDHIGANKSISAGKIAEMLGLRQEDTHVEPRKYIRQAISELKIPIASNSKGYYLIADKAELEKYSHALDNRIKGIEDRKKIVSDAFKAYYNL
jgi:hypothetical protein